MSTLGVIGYFVLAVTVLRLTIAVLGIYRRIEDAVVPEQHSWPSSTLTPGKPLPECRGFVLHDPSRTKLLRAHSDDFLFCLASSRAREGYAAVMTAVALAAETNLELILGVEMPSFDEFPRYISILAAEVADRTTALPPPEFARLGLRTSSAIGFVRGGMVKHLTARVIDPSDALYQFRFLLRTVSKGVRDG